MSIALLRAIYQWLREKEGADSTYLYNKNSREVVIIVTTSLLFW